MRPITTTERHFTAEEIAEMWNLSSTTMSRIFRDEPGVLRLTQNRRGKRKYTSMRTRESVLQRVYGRLTR